LIEVVIGIAIIVTPFVVTAKQRRDERIERERLEAERAETERRNREIIGSFAAKLERLGNGESPRDLEEIRNERRSRDIPYDAVAPMARAAVLRIGFRELAAYPGRGAKVIAERVDAAADAVGLTSDDATALRNELYRTALWHLIADGRLDVPERHALDQLGKALRIDPGAVELEARAADEFQRIVALLENGAPETKVPFKMRLRETCHHHGPATRMRNQKERISENGKRRRVRRWKPAGECDLWVTSRRLILNGAKHEELALDEVDDLELDADQNLLTVVTADPNKRATLSTEEPMYTATLIELLAHRARRIAMHS
ncbi:MAG: hypothetical protein WBX15_06315, partial [Thermoanaerobaculia bacterium]